MEIQFHLGILVGNGWYGIEAQMIRHESLQQASFAAEIPP